MPLPFKVDVNLCVVAAFTPGVKKTAEGIFLLQCCYWLLESGTGQQFVPILTQHHTFCPVPLSSPHHLSPPHPHNSHPHPLTIPATTVPVPSPVLHQSIVLWPLINDFKFQFHYQ